MEIGSNLIFDLHLQSYLIFLFLKGSLSESGFFSINQEEHLKVETGSRDLFLIIVDVAGMNPGSK